MGNSGIAPDAEASADEAQVYYGNCAGCTAKDSVALICIIQQLLR